MEERQHHLNESSSARLGRSQKLEILPSPNSKSLGAYFLGAYTFHKAQRFQRPPCYCRILADILDMHIFFKMYAYILIGSKHFGDAQIF
jgi:hypothetical protein